MKSNPLATRFVAPGKIPWQSQPGQSLSELSQLFSQQLHSRAAIIGPHGSGKSTLLEHLVPLLGRVVLRKATYSLEAEGDWEREPQPVSDSTGSNVTWLQLRGRAASRRLLLETRGSWRRGDSLLVIDGYEQLSRIARGFVLAATRACGAGLLVTSHRTTWLPTLMETEVDVGLAQSLLEQLLPPDAADRERMVDAEHLDTLLDKHDGNLREVFMELYDVLEQAGDY